MVIVDAWGVAERVVMAADVIVDMWVVKDVAVVVVMAVSAWGVA